MTKILNLLLGLILVSCVSTTTIVDTDDLYFSKRTIDTIVVKKHTRYINVDSYHYVYYPVNRRWRTGYNYGYPEWSQPKYIIVSPTTPGKRPSRERNSQKSSPNIRRNR